MTSLTALTANAHLLHANTKLDELYVIHDTVFNLGKDAKTKRLNGIIAEIETCMVAAGMTNQLNIVPPTTTGKAESSSTKDATTTATTTATATTTSSVSLHLSPLPRMHARTHSRTPLQRARRPPSFTARPIPRRRHGHRGVPRRGGDSARRGRGFQHSRRSRRDQAGVRRLEERPARLPQG